MVQTEKRLAELGIVLPPPPKPAANYVPCVRVGNTLYLSGHIPLVEVDDGTGGKTTTLLTGRLGNGPNEMSVEEGYQAARQVGMNILATLQNELNGDLDRVVRIVKLFGIVRSSDDFNEQHLCVNGVSDLMVEVFGPERGVHARSAVGTNALPLSACVEVEAIVTVRE